MMQLGLTQEQKAARRKFLGGSDAGAIVAGGEAWVELWKEKTGRSQGPDLSNVLAVMMGNATEPFNRYWYTKQTGRAVERDGELQRHPTISYLACNLDGVTTTEAGHPASFQAKHVGKSGDQMVLRYTAQCTHEALCCGFDWYVMSTFVGNSKWELHEDQVDPFFAAEYLEKCEAFWWHVENDREPEIAAPLPVPPPKKLRTVTLYDDEELAWIHDSIHGTYSGSCPECAQLTARQPNWGPAAVEALGIWRRTEMAHKAYMAAHGDVKKLMPEDVGAIILGKLRAAKDKIGKITISHMKDKES